MTIMTDDQYAAGLAKSLRLFRLQSSSEAALQRSIRHALLTLGLPFERERALSAADRPDFLLRDGAIVLEAKARYPRKQIYRQIERYAAHDSVKALLLVTGTVMGMPEAINGKPVYVVTLGSGSLGC